MFTLLFSVFLFCVFQSEREKERDMLNRSHFCVLYGNNYLTACWSGKDLNGCVWVSLPLLMVNECSVLTGTDWVCTWACPHVSVYYAWMEASWRVGNVFLDMIVSASTDPISWRRSVLYTFVCVFVCLCACVCMCAVLILGYMSVYAFGHNPYVSIKSSIGILLLSTRNSINMLWFYWLNQL